MKVGDLVRWIASDEVGIVTYINGYMYQVFWTDGHLGHHYDYNLEAV